MKPLPTTDLRQNVLTAGVMPKDLPRVAKAMLAVLPTESYDPNFQGQELETYYFDTAHFDLRKARRAGGKYCTVRIRCYGGNDTYAISAKTEAGKFRQEIPDTQAEDWVKNGNLPLDIFPGDITARLIELTQGRPLTCVVAVCFTRYAVEDNINRLTLDIGTHTSTGKCFPCAVLEGKTTESPAVPIPEIEALGLPRLKLSKFLWGTRT